MKPWFTVNAKAPEEHEILIYDQIGKDFFSQDGVSAKDFAQALSTIPKGSRITVGINSPGGNVWDGLAIFNQLRSRSPNVTTRVDGIAASIASVIFLAGDKRIMPENAQAMIHRAWGQVVGNAEDLTKAASDLEKHDTILARIYAERTGTNVARIEQMMSDETWLNGQECKGLGFATDTSEAVRISAQFTALSRYRNVPAALTENNAATPQNNNNTMTQPQTPAATAGQAAPASPTQNATNNPQASAPAAQAAPQAPQPVLIADIEALRRENAEIRAALAAISAVQGFAPVSAPVAHSGSSVQNLGNPLWEAYSRMKPGQERMQFRVNNHGDLMRIVPKASNTFDSALVPAYLEDAVITVLSNRLALLSSFSREFSLDRMRPRASVVITKASSGPTVQTNATNFESGNTTLDPITVTVNQYSASWNIINTELNQGFKLQQGAEIAANNLADKISDVCTALMTAGNYTAGTLAIGTAANFDATDLPAIRSVAKNYLRKNLILDGGHLSYLLPTDRTKFALGEQGAYGFDLIAEQNRWTSAATNACGFVCSPAAMAVATGLPLDIPASEFLSIGNAQTKQGVAVQTCTWFSRAGREHWASLDVMFGAAAGDVTTGRVLVTA